ncbi:universal stress protein [Brevibacillus sp. SYP-B805]|uniref:universal stress protein n=1 Tax=Brevibacillus sp. SYP-B805 TaxID=1578199 RepID=UPI0013EC5B78|nr:universal stress protein [Brevibacillus sp. SYP-B805]NGQ95792.1 universal stress protein [Brevibacillus sp. SYP-B805]
MYHKILVPLDGSRHSERALQEVIKICQGQEKEYEVTLLHVVPPLTPGVNAFLHDTDIDVDGVIRRQGEEVLAKGAEALKAAGISFLIDVKVGDPAQEICIQSKYENYDLIVMGSRGLGYFKELMLGSVSHKVLQNAECPILIVK